MKTILRVYDFDIKNGYVKTNKGFFTNKQFNAILFNIEQIKKNYITAFDIREIKNGWILPFQPSEYLKYVHLV